MIDGFNARDLFASLSWRRRTPAFSATPPLLVKIDPRILQDPRQRTDTVTLSEGGQKIVNLNRANELGTELRAEKDPDKFRDKLRLAMEDIRRIGRLFGEVSRALFHGFRRRSG